jgi:hypothetical protein
MLRAQDRFRRPTEAGLRFTVQQLPGETKHEFVSESLAKSGVMGLYERWKKARGLKPQDYPECKAVLIDTQGMTVLVYAFNARALACQPPQSFVMQPVTIDYPGGHIVLRPAGLAKRKP